ncbi:MAG: recombinase family protein [Peptococcaceae bacterium]|nr:recombinase family protein [Peptococcaceae bacterium]
MKVAVYCRVSTEDQAFSRTIENQVEFAARYCELNGLEIYDFYLDEGVSGTVPVEKRPAGSRMMADALGGRFGAVCVYRLDRLARTALEILRTHQRLAEADVVLKSMTENFDTSTPSGKFFMTTLGGIAEIERETIAERMRLGKDRALREGRWPGGPPPYGYSLSGGRLVVNCDEAKTVRKIFKLYTEGGMSTGLIADYLNATGVPAPGFSAGKGGSPKNRWHRSRVWSILSNSAYRGVFLYHRRGGDGPVEFRCPPLVSDQEWEAALETRRKNYSDAGRNAKREYLLKGLIRCALCGRPYYGDGSGKRGRRFYYRCAGSTSGRANSHPCPSRSVRAELIENMVWNDIRRFVLGARQTLDRVGRRAAPDPGRLRADRMEAAAIDAAVEAKEKERKRIIDLCRRQIISEADLKRELAVISREQEALNKRRMAVDARADGRADNVEIRPLLIGRLESACCRDKRELVRGLVESITVDTVERAGKILSRVTIAYVFEGPAGCALIVETRGKYRLGVPRSPY